MPSNLDYRPGKEQKFLQPLGIESLWSVLFSQGESKSAERGLRESFREPCQGRSRGARRLDTRDSYRNGGASLMRIGLLGAGRIGAFHAGVLAGHEDVSTLMIGDVDAERAAAVAEEVGGQPGTIEEVVGLGL